MSDPNSGYNSNNAIPRKPITMFKQYDDGVYNVRIEVVGDVKTSDIDGVILLYMAQATHKALKTNNIHVSQMLRDYATFWALKLGFK